MTDDTSQESHSAGLFIFLTPVVQTLDSAIYWSNHYIQWISIRETYIYATRERSLSSG